MLWMEPSTLWWCVLYRIHLAKIGVIDGFDNEELPAKRENLSNLEDIEPPLLLLDSLRWGGVFTQNPL